MLPSRLAFISYTGPIYKSGGLSQAPGPEFHHPGTLHKQGSPGLTAGHLRILPCGAGLVGLLPPHSAHAPWPHTGCRVCTGGAPPLRCRTLVHTWPAPPCGLHICPFLALDGVWACTPPLRLVCHLAHDARKMQFLPPKKGQHVGGAALLDLDRASGLA